MNKFAALLPAMLLGLSTFAGAQDYESRSVSDRSWSGGRYHEEKKDPNAPAYYRPTMRYYGAGYTISYRYIPVSSFDAYSLTAHGATNFRTEKFHIATEDIPNWGTNSPRLTVKDPRSAAPRSAVTSIVRKKSSTRSTTTPAPAESPTIVPSIPDSPAPAPAPAPTDAPKP